MCCCFSGHRPQQLPWKTNENDERCILLKKLLSEIIQQRIDDGVTEFICGMARGTDMYAAEEVLKKKSVDNRIRLHTVLPCPQQADRWCEADRARYRKILQSCDEKTIISPIYTRDCMLARNRFMVDNASALIAVWNGTFNGGTAYTVRYAKKLGRTIYLLRPKDMSTTIL